MRGELRNALQSALLRKKATRPSGCVIWFWAFALAVGGVILWMIFK